MPKSKWKPGTRVRSIADDGTNGMTGTVEAVNYAESEEATSVLMDRHEGGFDVLGSFFRDDELVAE
jgi:hypothetical protein